jgi:hypothetical protein
MPTAWTVRGSNPDGGEILRTCPDRPWGPLSLLYNGYRVFPGGKVRPGRDADPSPPSSAKVKNRVELYPYSPQGPLWPTKGWNLPTYPWNSFVTVTACPCFWTRSTPKRVRICSKLRINISYFRVQQKIAYGKTGWIDIITNISKIVTYKAVFL